MIERIKKIYLYAGIYGILALLPQYFLETKTGTDYPPPITHPEFFYGFTGVALAWQVLFIIISKDPVRFRPVMIGTILEKASFGIAVAVLFLQGRVPGILTLFGGIDTFLMCLFIYAYMKTPEE